MVTISPNRRAQKSDFVVVVERANSELSFFRQLSNFPKNRSFIPSSTFENRVSRGVRIKDFLAKVQIIFVVHGYAPY